MGCWDTSGFASRIGISSGTDVKGFLYRRTSEAKEWCQEHRLIAPPVTGKYNDYGSIEEIDVDQVSEQLELYFGQDAATIFDYVERNMKGYLSKSDTLSKLKWKNRELLDELFLVMEHSCFYSELVGQFRERTSWQSNIHAIPCDTEEYLASMFGFVDDKSPDGIIVWSHSDYELRGTYEGDTHILDRSGNAIYEFYKRHKIPMYDRLQMLAIDTSCSFVEIEHWDRLLMPFLKQPLANFRYDKGDRSDEVLELIDSDTRHRRKAVLEDTIFVDMMNPDGTVEPEAMKAEVCDCYAFYTMMSELGIRIHQPLTGDQHPDAGRQTISMIDAYTVLGKCLNQ